MTIIIVLGFILSHVKYYQTKTNTWTLAKKNIKKLAPPAPSIGLSDNIDIFGKTCIFKKDEKLEN